MSEIRAILADDAVEVRTTIAQILALEPDIAVPGMDGGAVAGAIADTGTRALVLAGITAAGTCQTAMRAGVRGWVARTAPAHRLLAAVRAVAAGEHYVDPDLVDAADNPIWPAGPPGATRTPLTARERRVLSAVSVLGSTREIRVAVGLSAETVGRDRMDAARIASTRGWL